MTGKANQPYGDQVTLSGADTQVYEAIATLEFSGRAVTVPDIAATTGLDGGIVQDTLRTLTQRGVLVVNEETEPTYEPAHRGWSAAPGQAENPAR